MQTDFGGNNQTQRPIVIPELDELQFKAIGEGLGFHQQEEKPRWKNPATRQSIQAASTHQPSQTIQRSTPSANVGMSREQLGAIYQAPAATNTTSHKSAIKNKQTVKTA